MFARPWSPPDQQPGMSLYVECQEDEGFSGGVLVVRMESRYDDHAGELRPVSLSLRDSKILGRLETEQTALPTLPDLTESEEGEGAEGAE